MGCCCYNNENIREERYLKLAFVQTRPKFGEIEDNIRIALKHAASAKADLVVLPELFSTGYCFSDREQTRRLAEPVKGGLAIKSAIAASMDQDCFIAGGFAEASGKKVYNSSFLVGPEGLLMVYRKLHLFADENDLFDPGDRPPAVVDIGHCRVGLMVCFDWTFPEMARSLMLAGAQVIAHPSNLVMAHCQKAMVTRCLENAVFAVTANRVGTENNGRGQKLTFTGGSQITGPDGRVLASAPKNTVTVKTVGIDPARALAKNWNPKNHRVKDRRPRFYL